MTNIDSTPIQVDCIDKHSLDCLINICAYLNTTRFNFILVELDIAIDAYCPFNNILSFCFKRSPNVVYNEIGRIQCFRSLLKRESQTSYIEDYSDQTKRKNAVLRAYQYDKSAKENLPFPLTRFEVKLQSRYFTKHGLSSSSIIDTLQRYYVVYFNDLNEKYYAVNQLNNNVPTRRNNIINRLSFTDYRLYPNIEVISEIIRQIETVYVNFYGQVVIPTKIESSLFTF